MNAFAQLYLDFCEWWATAFPPLAFVALSAWALREWIRAVCRAEIRRREAARAAEFAAWDAEAKAAADDALAAALMAEIVEGGRR